MINVLIFPAGTEIGREIYLSLRNEKNINLVLAGADYDSHARHYACEYHVVPDVTHHDGLPVLQALLVQESIDYIFPAHDDALLFLSENRKALSATVLCPSQETCRITRFKSKTYQALKGAVPLPAVFNDPSAIAQWPVFVKPDRGQGAQGALRVDSPERLASILAERNDLIICEYLNGEEFTVDCFSDRAQGLLFCQPRIRSRIRAGIAMTSTLVSLPEVDAYARAISQKLQLYGAWFFQLKRSASGTLTLLEVAPRIAGTMALNRVAGINFAMLTLYESMRVNINILPTINDIQITRSLSNRYQHRIKFKHVYIDYDDTIVNNGKLCLLVITFLYQCINNGIKLHLITRHAGNIHSSLREMRLDNVFDTITHLGQKDKKSIYITERNAIFIDDSFRERLDVFSHTQIPTFDINQIEMLIDS
ncbi:ATP-grasp domain-containing protein [Citrobacter sp. HN-141]|uniref:ATP-grasp domain-containing protein n=1 Tax=unclassified Citrobacter TaxID=2644389 RepID=UPI0029654B42|nr:MULTISPECIES: ATP-grasp domain-containing protein [unclassified Citrobacter]MDW2642568.1 ATP-grasp domain-containing protein [Citrobacter sp. HN-141]MDW2652179.1 ATP-grasp domain-containing protein [Citrobacter sp. HN-120]MDW2695204.1 ATP-grasp domain-containing protein [Citrobacter sp. HN-144]